MENQKNIGQIIREYRNMKNLSLRDLEKKTSISFSHLSKIERGEYVPSRLNLLVICSSLKVSGDDTNKILLLAEYAPMSAVTIDPSLRTPKLDALIAGLTPYVPANMVKLPILGTIRAGEPIIMNDNIEGYDSVEPELMRGRDGFILKVKGNSMSGDDIKDGYKVAVVIQDDVEPSDIAVVAINGEEATLKRVKCQNGVCVLSPSNTGYEIMIYPANEVKVIGKVVRHWKDY